MQRKPFNNELDELLYDDSKYDPYALDKTLQGISKDDEWDRPNKNNDRKDEKNSFEENYLRNNKKDNGYSFGLDSLGSKEHHLSLYSEERGYSYEDGGLVKLKKYWDNKGFWYKFFIIDIVVGVIVEILLHNYTP